MTNWVVWIALGIGTATGLKCRFPTMPAWGWWAGVVLYTILGWSTSWTRR